MALTGFLQGSICYSDINAAYSAYAQSIPTPLPTTTSFDAMSFCSTCGWNGVLGHYYFNHASVVLGVKTWIYNTFIEPPIFQSCDPLQPFLDGSFLGFTVAGAVISVSLLAVLRRAL